MKIMPNITTKTQQRVKPLKLSIHYRFCDIQKFNLVEFIICFFHNRITQWQKVVF